MGQEIIQTAQYLNFCSIHLGPTICFFLIRNTYVEASIAKPGSLELKFKPFTNNKTKMETEMGKLQSVLALQKLLFHSFTER